MPAAVADIAAGTRESTVVTWTGSAIGARYPNARDGSVTPARGYLDAAGDAQAMVNARGALIGVERRRFAVDAHEIVWPDLSAAVPTVRLIDGEQRVDASMLCARIEIDLEAGTTSFELFG